MPVDVGFGLAITAVRALLERYQTKATVNGLLAESAKLLITAERNLTNARADEERARVIERCHPGQLVTLEQELRRCLSAQIHRELQSDVSRWRERQYWTPLRKLVKLHVKDCQSLNLNIKGTSDLPERVGLPIVYGGDETDALAVLQPDVLTNSPATSKSANGSASEEAALRNGLTYLIVLTLLLAQSSMQASQDLRAITRDIALMRRVMLGEVALEADVNESPTAALSAAHGSQESPSAVSPMSSTDTFFTAQEPESSDRESA
ncbi:unnamed protein product [Peniophora sp. CBMAI 1063]|nr:unnamed protein product [Peniophora sp. CBMAI 1063]